MILEEKLGMGMSFSIWSFVYFVFMKNNDIDVERKRDW